VKVVIHTLINLVVGRARTERADSAVVALEHGLCIGRRCGSEQTFDCEFRCLRPQEIQRLAHIRGSTRSSDAADLVAMSGYGCAERTATQ
jgi:hypothetical protein